MANFHWLNRILKCCVCSTNCKFLQSNSSSFDTAKHRTKTPVHYKRLNNTQDFPKPNPSAPRTDLTCWEVAHLLDRSAFKKVHFISGLRTWELLKLSQVMHFIMIKNENDIKMPLKDVALYLSCFVHDWQRKLTPVLHFLCFLYISIIYQY